MPSQSDVNTAVTTMKASLATAQTAAGQVTSGTAALQAAIGSIADHPAIDVSALAALLLIIANLLDALITATSATVTTTALRAAIAALALNGDMTAVKAALNDVVSLAQSADHNTPAVNGALDVHSKLIALVVDQANYSGVTTPVYSGG